MYIIGPYKKDLLENVLVMIFINKSFIGQHFFQGWNNWQVKYDRECKSSDIKIGEGKQSVFDCAHDCRGEMAKETRGGNERECEFVSWGYIGGGKDKFCYRENGKECWQDDELEQDDYSIYKVERRRK